MSDSGDSAANGDEPMPKEVPAEDRPSRFVEPQAADSDASRGAGETARDTTHSDPRFNEGASPEGATIPEPGDE